jgi:hypothetical protein
MQQVREPKAGKVSQIRTARRTAGTQAVGSLD